MASKKRSALYVDGFNFYYGVRNHFKPGQPARGFSLSGLCWCDFRALVERHHLAPDYQLSPVRYFTAPVTERVESTLEEHERYQLWLDAARTIPGLEVIDGFHRKGGGGKPREEKETDVNLAVELLLDGMNGVYDRAIVLSGDADQIPAILAAALRLPRPRSVLVLIPPSQDVDDWKNRYCEFACQLKLRATLHPAAPHQIDVARLDEKQLANSLLRYELASVSCPPYWRLPARYLDAHCLPRHRPDR